MNWNSTYSIMKKAQVYSVLVFLLDDERKRRGEASWKTLTRPWIRRRKSESAIECFVFSEIFMYRQILLSCFHFQPFFLLPCYFFLQNLWLNNRCCKKCFKKWQHKGFFPNYLWSMNLCYLQDATKLYWSGLVVCCWQQNSPSKMLQNKAILLWETKYFVKAYFCCNRAGKLSRVLKVLVFLHEFLPLWVFFVLNHGKWEHNSEKYKIRSEEVLKKLSALKKVYFWIIF